MKEKSKKKKPLAVMMMKTCPDVDRDGFIERERKRKRTRNV